MELWQSVLMTLNAYPAFFWGVLIYISLMVGSFLNVVIYRLPLMMEREWQQQCAEFCGSAQANQPQGTFNLMLPLSHCPHCQTPIKPWHNIPVLGYLFLGGKSACCKRPIAWRYPAIEALTLALSLVVGLRFGVSLETVAVLGFTFILVALTFIDLDHLLLPDNLVYPLLWSGLLLNVYGVFTDFDSAVWGAVVGYGSLWSLYWAFKLLRGKEGMGYGDFKLLAALGAWVGLAQLPLIVLIASVAGSLVGVLSLVFKRMERETPMPFGPFLAAAGWVVLLWGDELGGLVF